MRGRVRESARLFVRESVEREGECVRESASARECVRVCESA